MNAAAPVFLLTFLSTSFVGDDVPPARWGGHGHTIAARAAVQTLPDGMPAFFLDAIDQLAYLNPEPDRWRDRTESQLDPAMNDAFAPDHWINYERVPDGALDAGNRFEFIVALARAGEDAEVVGMLPYRILEMTQRLRSGFRRWREETDPAARRWIEQRILNDAGVLGHYVTDGSNPHHTTVHHDGWVGENPQGYTAEGGFHGRFEGQFVDARVALEDLLAAMQAAPRVFGSVRDATFEHLEQSHAQVIRLYELDRQRAFDRDNDSSEHKAFAVQRLAAGAAMLRDVWWTAWVTSESEAPPRRGRR
jgi:hypothetical protein